MTKKEEDILDVLEEDSDTSKEPPSLCVVRLTTSAWSDKKGIHFEKKITYLKRMSTGYQILGEDVNNIGASEVVERIQNLDECKDGIYKVVTVDETRDYETGDIDDYDYEFIPYKP